MKLNTNSNVYTFVYMTIVVIIVAVLLALANQALKPRQDANILLDKQKQILGAITPSYRTRSSTAKPKFMSLTSTVLSSTFCR